MVEVGEAEVRHLDLALLGSGEDDPGLRERRGRACLCLLDLGPRQHARGEGYEGSGRVASDWKFVAACSGGRYLRILALRDRRWVRG